MWVDRGAMDALCLESVGLQSVGCYVCHSTEVRWMHPAWNLFVYQV